MKVLMLTTDHIVIDRRIIQHANSLQKHGMKVTLLAGFTCAKNEKFEISGIQVERFSFSGSDPRFISFMQKIHLKQGKFYQTLQKLYRVFNKLFAKLSSFDYFIYKITENTP